MVESIKPTRLTDEAFGNLSRLMAGEALMRLEELRQSSKEWQERVAAYERDQSNTALELRSALEQERQLNVDHGETIKRLRENNADLLKRLQLLGPKR